MNCPICHKRIKKSDFVGIKRIEVGLFEKHGRIEFLIDTNPWMCRGCMLETLGQHCQLAGKWVGK
jgi:hypothetical protein